MRGHEVGPFHKSLKLLKCSRTSVAYFGIVATETRPVPSTCQGGTRPQLRVVACTFRSPVRACTSHFRVDQTRPTHLSPLKVNPQEMAESIEEGWTLNARSWVELPILALWDQCSTFEQCLSCYPKEKGTKQLDLKRLWRKAWSSREAQHKKANKVTKQHLWPWRIPWRRKKSIFIAIPKIAGITYFESHRTISLMSHMTKLMLKIIVARAKTIQTEIGRQKRDFLKAQDLETLFWCYAYYLKEQ